MIGTSIRSVRHLFRVSGTSLKTILVKNSNYELDICKVVKFPNGSSFGEMMFIFNHHIHSSPWTCDRIIASADFKERFDANDVLDNIRRVIAVNSDNLSYASEYFYEITLLPDSFESDYEKFLKDNNKMVTNLTNKFGIHTKDIMLKILYAYTDGSKNFFQWAVTSRCLNKIPLRTLKNIFTWHDSYKQLAKNLSKGTITAYTSRDSIFKLIEELEELKKEKRINDSINSFNTAQKKLLRTNKLGDNDRQALLRFSRLSEAKRLNFIKKVSSITNFDELLRQLRFATSVHFSWSKESFMDFLENVEGIKYEKVYENNDIVLVKVLDYETIKQLGKTTNWCISKNKSYWKNYVEKHHGAASQYVIFDFSKREDDKLSIVGFTVMHNKGITAAHNFINENLMGCGIQEPNFLNSFIDRFNENPHDIHSLLANDGIDITLVSQYDMPPYKWDEDSLMNYLYECVNRENVDVLKNSEGKMVLSIMDENIRYFFGDRYINVIPNEHWEFQHILFIDFTKSIYDVDKIQFAIIDGSSDGEYCLSMYDSGMMQLSINVFEANLVEFGLPYNTIRRVNDPYSRLKLGLLSYHARIIDSCVTEFRKGFKGVLHKLINKEIGQDTFTRMIIRTVKQYMSFDYLKLVYDNGGKLTDYIANEYVGAILKDLVTCMIGLSETTTMFKDIEGVSEENIKDFYDGNYGMDDTRYVGLFIAVKMIIDNEKGLPKRDYNTMFHRVLRIIANDHRGTQLYNQLVDILKDKLDYSVLDDAIYSIIDYAIFYGNEDLKKFVGGKAKDSSSVKKRYEDVMSSYENSHDFHNIKAIDENNGVYTVRVLADDNAINPLEFAGVDVLALEDVDEPALEDDYDNQF